MNKLYILLGLVFVFFATTVSAATVSMITGTITNEGAAVEGATVTVTCHHGAAENVKSALTGNDGKYYIFYPNLQCTAQDSVSIHVVKDDMKGDGNGIVAYNENCKINTELTDVQIPEFGIVAAAIALIGAIGIIAYRRS